MYGCGWQVGVVSRRWVWLVGVGRIYGVVVRRYIDFCILLIPIPLVSVIFWQHSYFLFIKFFCFVLVPVLFCNYILCIK